MNQGPRHMSRKHRRRRPAMTEAQETALIALGSAGTVFALGLLIALKAVMPG